MAEKIEGVAAIDGKTARRSRNGAKGRRPAHVVSAWACEASMVPGQLRVDEKPNEIKAIPELLGILCLKGCIVAIDAMGTQKEIAEKIIEKGADYILQVKGNQETLMEDIALYFEKEIFPCGKRYRVAEEKPSGLERAGRGRGLQGSSNREGENNNKHILLYIQPEGDGGCRIWKKRQSALGNRIGAALGAGYRVPRG